MLLRHVGAEKMLVRQVSAASRQDGRGEIGIKTVNEIGMKLTSGTEMKR